MACLWLLGPLPGWPQADRGDELLAVQAAESHVMEQPHRHATWRDQAKLAIRDGRLLSPEGDSAVFYLNQILAERPDDDQALKGLVEVQRQLIEKARRAATELDFESANEWLARASAVTDDPSPVEAARRELARSRAREQARISVEIDGLLAKGAFNQAEIRLIDLVALGAGTELIDDWRRRIEQARAYGVFDPREVVRDPILGTEQHAPPLIVVPAGSFLMGAPERDREAREDQRPQHRVTISRGFALGRTEITVAEFSEFVRVARYRTEAEQERFSRVYDERSGRISRRAGVHWRHDHAGENADGSMPVLHVSWNDAKAYVTWLANATGKPYRLPSEAEFEYALRAGSTSAFWWGEGSPAEPLENLTGDADVSPQGRNWSVSFDGYGDGYWGPAPVGSFLPNAFGLHDMAGNVSEWVTDCWHASYVRAPSDGSPWVNPGCSKRVIRGGYWASSPAQARSAARLYGDAQLRGPRAGFRIARDL